MEIAQSFVFGFLCCAAVSAVFYCALEGKKTNKTAQENDVVFPREENAFQRRDRIDAEKRAKAMESALNMMRLFEVHLLNPQTKTMSAANQKRFERAKQALAELEYVYAVISRKEQVSYADENNLAKAHRVLAEACSTNNNSKSRFW